MTCRTIVVVALFLCPSAAWAQWNPPAGQWLKSEPTDIRVMTWNVRDGICSTNTKSEGLNNWTALARIVASLKPDVLLLQETGDNSGNGTGGSSDSPAVLTATFEQFLYGGAGVTAWVQKYDPNFDMPYIFVSTVSDGFNRNSLLSRYPFVDLNGDTKATMSDMPFMLADQYATAGTGGIRGIQWAEIDLPDDVYAGDLVVGNAHLKAGGTASDQNDRRLAAQRTAYFIHHFFNGANAGVVDPFNKILDSPPATSILSPETPVMFGGDLNEDELTNGQKGPAEWITQAAVAGGADGTDRDRSDMAYDSAVTFFNGSRATFGSSSKLDYICWQDSIAVLRRAFVFNTAEVPQVSMPPELIGFNPNPQLASNWASDHRCVVADFILPRAVAACPGDVNGDNQVTQADLGILLSAFGTCPGDAGYNAAAGGLAGDPCVTQADLGVLLSNFGQNCN